jgi:hypothetical protein
VKEGISAAVEARGGRKEYGGLVAVEDLTFAVDALSVGLSVRRRASD